MPVNNNDGADREYLRGLVGQRVLLYMDGNPSVGSHVIGTLRYSPSMRLFSVWGFCPADRPSLDSNWDIIPEDIIVPFPDGGEPLA